VFDREAAGMLRRSSEAPHGAADLSGEQRVKQHVIHVTSSASRSCSCLLLEQHVHQDSQETMANQCHWQSVQCLVSEELVQESILLKSKDGNSNAAL
jgi:hypothetical protein